MYNSWISFKIWIYQLKIAFKLPLSLLNILKCLSFRDNFLFELGEFEITMMKECFGLDNTLAHLLSFMTCILGFIQEIVKVIWLMKLGAFWQLLVWPIHLSFLLFQLINSVFLVLKIRMYFTCLTLQLFKSTEKLEVTLTFLLHCIVYTFCVLNQNLHRSIFCLPNLLKQWCQFSQIVSSFIY